MSDRPGNLWNGDPIAIVAPSLEMLVEMLREPPSCWMAFASLGRRSDEASLALLVGEASSTDQYRRRSAIEAIASHGLGRSALDVVRRLLQDPSPFVVRAAISAAQVLADAASHDLIAALLHDADPSTRTSALHALALLWRPSDFEATFQVAQHDPAKQVRRKASWTLRQHADQRTWRRLADYWIRSELPRERAWACELAMQFGSVADISLVMRCENDQDGHVRTAARHAIAALGQRTR